MRLLRMAVVSLALGFYTCSASAGESDPLQSPVWDMVASKTFGGAPYVFDDRVKVIVPMVVEDQAQVPVTADARAVPDVTQLALIADLNPIQHVLTLHIKKAEPYLSVRVKIEQSTPVRAAAMTSDGVWHVGGVQLEAQGGGCSSPAMARKDADWATTAGRSQGRIWRDADGSARLRLRVRHPMDTGLAKDGTPAFFIEKTEVKDPSGDGMATLEMFEPVSEDPTVTLLLKLAPSAGGVTIDGRDNNGGLFRSVVPAPWKSSALRPPQGFLTP